ncbi:MAG: sulfatase-like hydrolase/transferase [Terrimicrobiaceae bacterium]
MVPVAIAHGRFTSLAGAIAALCRGFCALESGHALASPLNRAVRTAANMEPAIPRAEQDKTVAEKLAALKKQAGKNPNVAWLVVDDMGYGAPGCYGGGKAIGADTPHMNRLALEGLRLTSWYSQNACTTTRSAMLTGRLPVRLHIDIIVKVILPQSTFSTSTWRP